MNNESKKFWKKIYLLTGKNIPLDFWENNPKLLGEYQFGDIQPLWISEISREYNYEKCHQSLADLGYWDDWKNEFTDKFIEEISK